MVYAVVAADYFHQGKKALPWCYVITAIVYTIVAFIKGKKGKARHARTVEVKAIGINDEKK